jgi:beta-1,4-N-acetylglucosaminyltransferase
MMKICFVASSGGHLEEIACLKPIAQAHESFLVTEKSDYADPEEFYQKSYFIRQINRRELFFVFHFIRLIVTAARILRKEKASVLVSTGALVTVPFCIVGKLRGMKIVYIESFARVNRPSLTGRILYLVADLFIVQWEELLSYFPKAHYTGGIF